MVYGTKPDANMEPPTPSKNPQMIFYQGLVRIYYIIIYAINDICKYTIFLLDPNQI